MKQTKQKKSKVFRTLIHRINISSKEGQKENKTQNTGKEQRDNLISFSASNKLSVNTGSFNFIKIKGGLEQFEDTKKPDISKCTLY